MRTRANQPLRPDQVFIDEKELSRRTTLSLTTLQVMRRKGGGPPFAKLGERRIAYRLSDVERWLAARIQGGPGGHPARPSNEQGQH